MAIALLARAENNYTGSTSGTPNSHTVTKPAEAVTGTFVLVHLCFAIPGNALAGLVTSVPAGWTALETQWRSSGTLSLRYASFWKIMQPGEPATWDWGYADSAANCVSVHEVYSGVDQTTPVAEHSSFVASTGSTSRATPTIVTSVETWITYNAADRSGSLPTAPAPDTATKLDARHSSDATITLAYSGTQPAGSYQRTFTDAANTSAYTTSIYALLPGAELPPGIPVEIFNGTSTDIGYMTIWDGTTETVPSAVESVDPPEPAVVYTVAEFASPSPLYIAHRGMSQAYPEMTLFAYDQATQVHGYKAIEVSVRKCLTGEFVCSHDWTTERVTGVRHEIWNTPWSTLSMLEAQPPAQNPEQVPRPFTQLLDVLDAYAATHVLLIDPKELSESTELLDLLDTYPNATDHFVFKTFKAGHAEAAAAKLRGYTTWGCYFSGESSTNPEYLDSFDILGMEWNADQVADWNPLVATGKPIIGHLCVNSGSRDSAVSKGATAIMSAVTTIGP